MNGDRKEKRVGNRIPQGLSFLIWPALLRAPWLAGSIFDTDPASYLSELERLAGLDEP